MSNFHKYRHQSAGPFKYIWYVLIAFFKHLQRLFKSFSLGAETQPEGPLVLHSQLSCKFLQILFKFFPLSQETQPKVSRRPQKWLFKLFTERGQARGFLRIACNYNKNRVLGNDKAQCWASWYVALYEVLYNNSIKTKTTDFDKVN